MDLAFAGKPPILVLANIYSRFLSESYLGTLSEGARSWVAKATRSLPRGIVAAALEGTT
jgi:hypothetical protein